MCVVSGQEGGGRRGGGGSRKTQRPICITVILSILFVIQGMCIPGEERETHKRGNGHIHRGERRREGGEGGEESRGGRGQGGEGGEGWGRGRRGERPGEEKKGGGGGGRQENRDILGGRTRQSEPACGTCGQLRTPRLYVAVCYV